jgi:hypothetical protein
VLPDNTNPPKVRARRPTPSGGPGNCHTPGLACGPMERVDLVIAGTALRQHGVYTRAPARAAGATPAMIRHRVASGRWGRLCAGVYRVSGSPATWDQKLFAAWLAAGEGAVVSHHSAAMQWELPGARPLLEITVPHGRRVSVPRIRLHRLSKLDTVDRVERGGLLVTTPARTVIDMCSQLGLDDMQRLLDHVFTRRMTTPEYLRRRCAALGRRGRSSIVRLEAMLDKRPGTRGAPESEFERRVLDVLREIGCPPPVLQYEVDLPDGRRVRLDFAWPDRTLAIEADSYVHHAGLADWSADHVRNAALIAMGWRILPVTWTMLTEQSEWLRELVASAFEADVGRKGVV